MWSWRSLLKTRNPWRYRSVVSPATLQCGHTEVLHYEGRCSRARNDGSGYGTVPSEAPRVGSVDSSTERLMNRL